MNNIITDHQAQKAADPFFSRHKIGTLMKQPNFKKRSGATPMAILKIIFSLIFSHKTWSQALSSNDPAATECKDSIYRFLASPNSNWERLLLLIAAKIVQKIEKSTGEERVSVFIIGSTFYSRMRSKKVELLSKVHDHIDGKYKWGFRMCTGAWSDGYTIIPVNFQLLSSRKEKNRRQEPNESIDGRTVGAKNRKKALMKESESAVNLAIAAKKNKIPFSYAIVDSWFALPPFFSKMKAACIECIAMLKKMKNIYYMHEGQKRALSQVYRALPKKRGKAKLLCEAIVSTIPGEEGCAPVELKIVFVRNKNKKKEWLAIASTDLSLAAEEIVRLYGRRWDIEVMFKACKSFLGLAREFSCRSFDSLAACTSIVLLRYMMLAEMQRDSEDPRTIGGFFILICDEARDTAFAEVLEELMMYFEEFLKNQFPYKSERIDEIVGSFFAGMPPGIRDRLAS